MKKTFAFASVVFVIIACGGSNGGPGGGSAVCGINGSNQCGGQQPFCDSTLGCVECRGDTDCPASDPRCISGRCRACASNSDCGAAAPACWADHQCHASCTPTSCPQETPICDTGTGDCLGCKSNADCAGNQNGTICDTQIARCVECMSNGDCPVSAPRCFLGDHSCVQCLSNSDCGSTAPDLRSAGAPLPHRLHEQLGLRQQPDGQDLQHDAELVRAVHRQQRLSVHRAALRHQPRSVRLVPRGRGLQQDARDPVLRHEGRHRRLRAVRQRQAVPDDGAELQQQRLRAVIS